MTTELSLNSCSFCTANVQPGEKCAGCATETPLRRKARALIETRAPDAAVISTLTAAGISDARARWIAADIRIADSQRTPAGQDAGQDDSETSAGSDLGWGLVLLVGGGIATAVTYAAAAPGGTYVVFWGAMLYGGYKVLKGLYRSGSGG